uniref:Uncharacterized protein n=1 Tax=Pristionchus pacificus TaxID=54126 RepID=A0A2A6BDT1_PRIPA|eukprot:PDM64047.1 hypothetical protein PRIPAC_54291 [Pristionchus pacificus]
MRYVVPSEHTHTPHDRTSEKQKGREAESGSEDGADDVDGSTPSPPFEEANDPVESEPRRAPDIRATMATAEIAACG